MNRKVKRYMKKVLISLLAVLAFTACASSNTNEEVKTEATNRIEVKNDTITVTQGQKKTEFKDQICDSIQLYDSTGAEASCDLFYYAKPLSTETVGEFTFEIAYKDGDSIATATLNLVVNEATED